MEQITFSQTSHINAESPDGSNYGTFLRVFLAKINRHLDQMSPLRNVTKQLCNESLIHSQMEIDFEVTEYLRAPPEIFF